MKSHYNITTDKLHFTPDARLSESDYKTCKAAGFAWWPGSKQFVAKWSTCAEDFVLSQGCEIADDDNPDDVAGRVERFEKYANSAESAVLSAEAHLDSDRCNTERRRKNAIRSAESNAEAAAHWLRRVESAIRHAEYKERPDVIARRIKGLEADLRKWIKTQSEHDFYLEAWNESGTEEIEWKRAQDISGGGRCSFCFPLAKYPRELPLSQYEGAQSLWSALGGSDGIHTAIITPEQARELATRHHAEQAGRCRRWIAHLENRIVYERAFFAAVGGSEIMINPPRKKAVQPKGVQQTRTGETPEKFGAFVRHSFFGEGITVYLITKLNRSTIEYLSSGMVRDFQGNEQRRFSLHKAEIYGLSKLKTAEQVKEEHPELLKDWQAVLDIQKRNAARKAEREAAVA